MANLKINVSDGAAVEDEAGNPAEEQRQSYTVTAKDGLFKNGKTYRKGSKIELTAETAKRFMELGEVKRT